GRDAVTGGPTGDGDRRHATDDPVHDRDAGDARDAAPPPADSVATSSRPPDPPATLSPPPWDMRSPLVAESTTARRRPVVARSPVQHGACVVTLENEQGRSRRVHICRNDGTPQGIIYTRRLDLVVMNEGHGNLPTDEGLAQAVARLAHVVAANERKA